MELLPSQLAFQDWLKDNAPYLMDLWDWEDRSVSLGRVERYLAVASHGEALMCRFAVAVWLGKNDFSFDLIEAAGVLDEQQRAAIAEWLKMPLWP